MHFRRIGRSIKKSDMGKTSEHARNRPDGSTTLSASFTFGDMLAISNAVARGRYIASPPASIKTPVPFIQRIDLFDGDQPIASASWFTTGNDGVVQLLDIRVIPELQRKGVGSSLFKQVQREADAFLRARGTYLRRVIAQTEQKSQIVSRAFFTRMGFHHVQTIANTLRNEDILVYLLGCD